MFDSLLEKAGSYGKEAKYKFSNWWKDNETGIKDLGKFVSVAGLIYGGIGFAYHFGSSIGDTIGYKIRHKNH